MILRVEDQRDEARAGLGDGMIELAGQVVAEGCGAHLGDGEAAGGDDEGLRADGALIGLDLETASCRIVSCALLGDGEDVGGKLDAGVGFGALAEEHVEDVVGGSVAEELAEGFLVIGDTVLFYQGDEVLRVVASEGGLGEVGVGGEEVFRPGVDIGEVASASSGDEDLFARAVGEIEDEDTAVAAAGFDGGHEAGGTGAEYQYINFCHRVIVSDWVARCYNELLRL